MAIKKRHLFLLASVLAGIALVMGILPIMNVDNPISKTVEFENVSVGVEVVDTPETRGLGLSGRRSLAENEGMWFVFEKPGLYHFHMKDMNFPIDIIWLDKDLLVVDITEELEPETFPQTFSSRRPVQYVLEVNAGFARRHNINVGDQVEFHP